MIDIHPYDDYYLRGLRGEISSAKFLPGEFRNKVLKALQDYEELLYVGDVHFTPTDLYWSPEGSGGSRWTKRSEWDKCRVLNLYLIYAYGDYIGVAGARDVEGKRALPLGIQIRPHGKTKQGFQIKIGTYGIAHSALGAVLKRFGLPDEEKMLNELEFNLCREFISWQEANIDGKSHRLLYDSEDKSKREVEKVFTKLGLITD